MNFLKMKSQYIKIMKLNFAERLELFTTSLPKKD
jgi:hypothetical protein